MIICCVFLNLVLNVSLLLPELVYFEVQFIAAKFCRKLFFAGRRFGQTLNRVVWKGCNRNVENSEKRGMKILPEVCFFDENDHNNQASKISTTIGKHRTSK